MYIYILLLLLLLLLYLVLYMYTHTYIWDSCSSASWPVIDIFSAQGWPLNCVQIRRHRLAETFFKSSGRYWLYECTRFLLLILRFCFMKMCPIGNTRRITRTKSHIPTLRKFERISDMCKFLSIFLTRSEVLNVLMRTFVQK